MSDTNKHLEQIWKEALEAADATTSKTLTPLNDLFGQSAPDLPAAVEASAPLITQKPIPPLSPTAPQRGFRWGRFVAVIIAVVLLILALRNCSGLNSIGRQPKFNEPAISGEWRIYNTIERTTYNRYHGLVLGYRVFLRQTGNSITGTGEKISENGNDIPQSAHSPIRLDGELKDGRLVANFVEDGARRTTTGYFEWQVLSNGGKLSGAFKHTAADAEGSSVGEKVK